MIIRTSDYVRIHILPDNAKCKEAGKSPCDLDYCPLAKFDQFGMVCVPSECEYYTEETTTMREILFRGKRRDNGEWIEGQYTCEEYDTWQNKIIHNAKIQPTGIPTEIPIFPETVGQYTGLTDNGGKKIFEGDIIRFTHFMVSDRLYVVEWNQESAMFYIKCSGCDSKYDQEAFDTNFEYTSREHFEIVGNIHDNPELLESAGKDAAPYADQPVLMNAT